MLKETTDSNAPRLDFGDSRINGTDPFYDFPNLFGYRSHVDGVNDVSDDLGLIDH
jgi:hypothetical protein